MATKPTILACMPTHSPAVDVNAIAALTSPTRRDDYEIVTQIRQKSLLAAGFNNFWCEALNANCDYFVMIHADVVPQAGWLDILMDEMKRTGADVMSAVIPLKDPCGLTSTAIGEPGNDWKPRRRLTMNEVYDLPETFDAADAGYPGDVLLVNTGCFLVDLSGDWCRAVKPDGTAEFHFTINDRIRVEDGRFEGDVEPEDWYASRQWARLGVNVMATRKVALSHRGVTDYSNTQAWGSLTEDFEATEKTTEHNADNPALTA